MDDVGTLLHAAVDDVPVRPLNAAALRSRVRRSRLVLVTAVATAAVAAAATVGLAPRPARVAAHPWRSTCPATDVLLWRGEAALSTPGPKDRMVPAGTRRVLVCRYGPVPDPFRPYEPDGAIVLPASHPRYRRIVDLVNAVRPDIDGPHSCPIERGARFVLLFERAHGDTLAVEVERDGCGYVRNGTRSGRFGSSAVDTELQLLFGEG